MSDEPLWSDLRVDARALKELNDYGTMTLFTAKRILGHMRDEYEAARQQDKRRIAELEAELTRWKHGIPFEGEKPED
jgi:hypothetical protein